MPTTPTPSSPHAPASPPPGAVHDDVLAAEASALTVAEREAHQRALMMQRRCPHCAEEVPPGAIFGNRPCPSCGMAVVWPAGEQLASVIDRVESLWRKRRWWIYTLVGSSVALTGVLPIVPTVLAVGILIAVRLTLLREPLQWFSPGRRFTTRFALKLWMVFVGCVTLLANALLNLFPGVNIVLKALVSLAMAALFVEIAVVFLRNRLHREAQHGPALQWWEWGLPVGMLGSVVVASVGAIASMVVVYEVVQGLVGSWFG